MTSRAAHHCCTACLLLLLSLPGWATLARAQDRVLSDLYGSGVHHYFAGDYQQGITDLTAAINAGSQDPRVFYFRGLTYSRMGDDGAAQADMQRGARLEAGDGGASYPVGRALERVQGPARQSLERYRAAGRTVARQTQINRDAQRYEQRRRAESEVLRNPSQPVPPVALPGPSDVGRPAKAHPVPVPAPPVADADLFGNEADAAQPAAAQPKAPKPAMNDADPLGVGDVGGGEDAGGAALAPADGQSDDLFGEGAEADDTVKPKPATAPRSPAAAKNAGPKQGATAPARPAAPKSTAPAAPPAAPPAKPAADTENPFGEEEAKEPANSKAASGDEDPFAN